MYAVKELIGHGIVKELKRQKFPGTGSECWKVKFGLLTPKVSQIDYTNDNCKCGTLDVRHLSNNGNELLC